MVQRCFYNLTLKLLVSHTNNGQNTTIRLSFEDGSHFIFNKHKDIFLDLM